MLVNNNLEVENETPMKKLQVSVNKRLGETEKKEGKIYEIVNWFLSQTTDENPITHLALQKLLYFSQSWNMVWNKKWLFEDECEAWVHGAVYRSVYEEFKKFKYKPLPRISKESSLPKEEIEVLQFVLKYYYDVYNAKTLEIICHLEEPYKIARSGYGEEDSCIEIIKKKDIENYYSEITKKYDISKNQPSHVKIYLNDLLA